MKAQALTVQDLNRLYQESEAVDMEVFAEQRTNILLVAGEHYQKRGSRYWNRIRDSKQLAQEQKVRLTKNHMAKISKTYVNNILHYSPDVAAVPKNEKELSDQKSAELSQAVWVHLKQTHKFREKRQLWGENFVQFGEVAVKVYFDPGAGKMLGYEAQMNPDTGQPELDPSGQMVPSDNAVMTGDLVYEAIDPFNLLRAAEAKSMWESRYLCYRKMIHIRDLQAMVEAIEDQKEREEKLKFVQSSGQDVYNVFDGSSGIYKSTKEMAMLREFYFRPCADYPNGYYYICTEYGVIWEGELPFGLFPIVYKGFDRIATTPRHRSIIKQLRPYQVEINRSASKMAEHQITLGDDKLLIQSGTKLAPGGQLPGVRGITFQGQAPTVLAGRSGAQYLEYMNAQITEMYQVAMVAESNEEENTGQIEPYTLLFRSMKNKKKFSIYAEKFEEFLVDIVELSLDLMQKYASPQMLIPAIGKHEFINIDEFKKVDKLSRKIALEPQCDDIESKMGKQLTLNHILQYTGNQLGKDDIGKIIRVMPYTNKEQIFNDLTLNYDNGTNNILAMDRGKPRPATLYDDHKYMISRLTNRMRQSDFEYLPPQVQQLYQQTLAQHEDFDAQQMRAIQAAKDGFIPSGGYLVACDFYVDNPQNPGSTRRARIPYESLNWLLQKLETQGAAMEDMQNLPQSAGAAIAQRLGQPPPGGMPPPGPQGPVGPH